MSIPSSQVRTEVCPVCKTVHDLPLCPTRSEETSAYSAEEIADAQRELDFHPSRSTFWDTRSGQDHLRVINELNLQPQTTEAERREIYRAEIAAARENAE